MERTTVHHKPQIARISNEHAKPPGHGGELPAKAQDQAGMGWRDMWEQNNLGTTVAGFNSDSSPEHSITARPFTQFR